jgi:hypothetical protein
MLIYSVNDFKRDGKLWSGLGFAVLEILRGFNIEKEGIPQQNPKLYLQTT